MVRTWGQPVGAANHPSVTRMQEDKFYQQPVSLEEDSESQRRPPTWWVPKQRTQLTYIQIQADGTAR